MHETNTASCHAGETDASGRANSSPFAAKAISGTCRRTPVTPPNGRYGGRTQGSVRSGSSSPDVFSCQDGVRRSPPELMPSDAPRPGICGRQGRHPGRASPQGSAIVQPSSLGRSRPSRYMDLSSKGRCQDGRVGLVVQATRYVVRQLRLAESSSSRSPGVLDQDDVAPNSVSTTLRSQVRDPQFIRRGCPVTPATWALVLGITTGELAYPPHGPSVLAIPCAFEPLALRRGTETPAESVQTDSMGGTGVDVTWQHALEVVQGIVQLARIVTSDRPTP